MSDEIAQKSGRGGASNSVTKTDAENGLQKSHPQKRSSGSNPTTDVQSRAYVRIGRGGIGNFIAPSGEPAASFSDAKGDIQPPRDALDSIREKLKDKPRHRGMSGRGGVGNWRQGNDQAERRRVEEKKMKIGGLVEMVVLNVEKGLKPPPEVHTNVYGRAI